jgi:hypothetical protein
MAHRSAESGADRIGALHIDLRLRVLSLLPADEAVRTCMLSREWRGLWRKMPSLRLVHHKDTSSSRFTAPKRFDDFVNYLLLFRDSLPLDE